MAFMLNNASNNDTFVDGIKLRCDKAGIPFNEKWARLWCMPHMIHLAAIKLYAKSFFNAKLKKIQQLLEAIGAVLATESKKAMLCGGNYQECLTAPLSNTADEDGDGDVDMNNDDHILTCVNKVNPWLFFCAY